jgi:hypothetical protein
MRKIYDNIEERLLPDLQIALGLASHADFCVGHPRLAHGPRLRQAIQGSQFQDTLGSRRVTLESKPRVFGVKPNHYIPGLNTFAFIDPTCVPHQLRAAQHRWRKGLLCHHGAAFWAPKVTIKRDTLPS